LFGGTVTFEARMLNLQNTQAVNLAGVPALAMPVPISAPEGSGEPANDWAKPK
jgi:Asp-tRNA(Asn)/Glu-tRNA(Gln) amidotransferase A subunit family amidase